MMIVLPLAPALSLALLAAHFYRDGNWPLALLSVALIGLLAWRRTWVPRLLQIALASGCVEWAWTMFVLVQQREAQGRPWGRLALILGVVTLFTAASAMALRDARVRRTFGVRHFVKDSQAWPHWVTTDRQNIRITDLQRPIAQLHRARCSTVPPLNTDWAKTQCRHS